MLAGILTLTFVPLIMTSVDAGFAESAELGIVRIRATTSDYRGHAYSTGTHLGDGWILTCGHCSKSMADGGIVEVQILSSTTGRATRKVRGRVVYSDAEAELGLIRLENGHGLYAAFELAPRGYRVLPGDEVVGFDWQAVGDGERLYSITRHVTFVNRYLGAANIETTGRPRIGSSGAPLVSKRDGRVIGVTHGALVHEDGGLYTATAAIYQFLEKQRRNERTATH